MGKFRVWLMLILCNLFWAGNYVFGKYVVAEMSPLWITFSRWLVAASLLMIIAHYWEKPDMRVVLKSWPKLMLLGILGIIGYNTILYAALDYTSSMNAALVNSLNPAVLVLASVIYLKERISKLQIIGLVTSLLGVAVILTQGNLGALLTTNYNKGDLLMLVAIVLWTFYSILGKKLSGIPPITTTAVSAIFATIIMAPFAIAQGIDIGSISPLAIAGIGYIILFPSIGSFIFWNMSIREIGGSKAGIFLNLIPVFTAIISWSLGERVTISQLSGGLFVFLGVLLTSGILEGKYKKGTNIKQETN